MAMGKHYGSFAKGFSDSLLAVMKMSMMMDYYKSRENYMNAHANYWNNHPLGGKGMDAGERGAYDAGRAGYGSGSDSGGGGGGGGAYEGGAKAEAHAAEMSDYLQKNYGLTKAGAAGVVGNAWQESKFASNFNPGGDKGSAAGMFQWREGRQTDARNWMAQNNKDPSDWKSHLDYAMHETQRDYPSMYNQLKTTNDPEYATHEFFHVFERGDPNKANFANRDGMAKAAFRGSADAPKTEVAAADKVTERAAKTKDVAKVTDADKPTKTATAEEAETKSDGKFKLPGSGDEVDTRTPEQMDRDSPAPPPGAAMPRNERAQEPPERAPPIGAPKVSGIPPGPTVPAQDAAPIEGPRIPEGGITTEAPEGAARPDAPGIGRRGLPPAPSIPIGGGEGNKMEAPSLPPVNMVRPEPPVPVGTINPNTDRSPVVSGAATINPNTDKSELNTPLPPPRPSDEADKPAPAAQPVSNTGRPTVTPVSNNPRFALIDRQNASAQQGQPGRGYQTALDLSHLWGPNPPLSERTPAPPPAAPPIKLPDDMGGVASAPDMGDVALGMQMGARKGGPIQRFANGGIPTRPTLGFAAGASVPYGTYDANPAPPMGIMNAGAYANPGYQLWRGGLQWLNSQPTSTFTNPATLTVGQEQQNFDALPANQQTWYNQQNADALSGGGGGSNNYWYYNPASLPSATPPATAAAPAAAAPAPTIINPPSVQNITTYPDTSTTTVDPTTTTTTGTPSVPNVITANTYDPNKIGTTGHGATTDSTGGTNYNVGSDDTTKQLLSRKGGPIQRFANGGIPSRPTMKFADAGSVAFSPVGYQGSRTQGEQYLYSPQYNGPTLQGGWTGTPYDQLAPNQQAWADTTKGLMGQWSQQAGQNYAAGSAGGMPPNSGPGPEGQITVMPSAIWPSTGPVAPTPINQPPPSSQNITTPIADTTAIDPTTTTTTGIPNVPNAITANTYDPNKIGTTGHGSTTDSSGGTNYSVGGDDTTKQILSRKGGPITPRVRYDDGGGVSPSVAGMPPGLGGAAPVPPIYFNPATYSGAGAPVGKGITQTSAPTFNAGAIPSLPMYRGGVVAFDDGGGVPDDTAGMMQTAMYDDMGDRQMEQEDQRATAANAPAAPQYITPSDFTAPAPTQGGRQGGAPTPQQGGGSAPPDPSTPQITDGQGNPSRGLIAAIGDGLHWLGDHLGLVGGAQAHPAIATDPNTQTNRANFSAGQNVGGLTKQGFDDAKDMQDPHHQLEERYRDLAGMEGAYKYLLSQGRDREAGQMAASMLQYSVVTSQNFSDQAAKELYDGNLKGAVDNINKASDAIPDGRSVHAELSPDGKTVTVTGSTLDGRTLWQKQGAAQAVLEHATAMGRTGKLQWDSLESQAAKYDPTFAGMQKARMGNEKAAAKDAADQKAQADANAQIAKFGPTYDEPDAAPTVTPATTPAIPNKASPTQVASASPDSGATTSSTPATAPSSDGSGAAVSHPAPADADSNAANAPAPAAQDVDLEHSVAYQSIPGQVRSTYFAADGRPIQGGKPMHPPPPIDEVTLKSYAPQVQAAYRERWQQYQSAVQQNEKAFQDEVNGRRRDIAADITSRRQATTDQAKLTSAETIETNREKAADTLQTSKATLDEHNANYADGIKRAEPRSAKDVTEELASEDPRITLAKVSLPDQQGVADGATAGTALAKAGFDAPTQRTIVRAFSNGFQRSPLNTKEEVAQGVMQFASGAPGKYVIDDRTGDYHISVVGDDKSISSFTVSPVDYQNLLRLNQAGAYRAETKKAIEDAPPPEARPYSGPTGTARHTTPAIPGRPSVGGTMTRHGTGPSVDPYAQP